MLSVTILGNNSAVPAHNRHPTAQVLQTLEHTFLIDCGEGTQMQITQYKIKRGKINHIFISHLHGDHYFGLVGLLTSFALNQRTADLHIYSPAPLQQIVRMQLEVAKANLSYQMIFHEIEEEGVLFEDKRFMVECFKVDHRITCWGFLFREKKHLRKINSDKARKYKIPPLFYENLHNGEDYITEDGKVIQNDILTTPVIPAKSYAYCADTKYCESIIEKVKGADLLYHETTYLKALEEKAGSRFHSTTHQAATIAQKAKVKKLIIGHFSSMYETLDEFKTEACEIFPNTEVATEGTCYIV